MSEYIEREMALESVREKLLICESLPDTIAKDASVFTLASMNDSLKSIPAVDVRPVVRAKWVYTDMSRLVCSNCGNPVAFALKEGVWYHGNFCPNCGADMRECEP